MYEIVFTKKAEKDFDSLEHGLKKRVVQVLERIRLNPRPFLKRLTGTDSYRLRVGDYRVIIDLEEAKKELVVLKIGHRKNVYD